MEHVDAVQRAAVGATLLPVSATAITTTTISRNNDTVLQFPTRLAVATSTALTAQQLAAESYYLPTLFITK